MAAADAPQARPIDNSNNVWASCFHRVKKTTTANKNRIKVFIGAIVNPTVYHAIKLTSTKKAQEAVCQLAFI